MKLKNWLTKTKIGVAAAILALAVWTSGCKSQEIKQPETAETTGEAAPPEVTTAPETSPSPSEDAPQGPPALRDARVMVEGKMWILHQLLRITGWPDRWPGRLRPESFKGILRQPA